MLAQHVGRGAGPHTPTPPSARSPSPRTRHYATIIVTVPHAQALTCACPRRRWWWRSAQGQGPAAAVRPRGAVRAPGHQLLSHASSRAHRGRVLVSRVCVGCVRRCRCGVVRRRYMQHNRDFVGASKAVQKVRNSNSPVLALKTAAHCAGPWAHCATTSKTLRATLRPLPRPCSRPRCKSSSAYLPRSVLRHSWAGYKTCRVFIKLILCSN